MWEEIEPFVWLGIVVGCVFLGRWLANRKANKLRQEGKQQAMAAIGARMATGNQTVLVDASGRVRDHATVEQLTAGQLRAVDLRAVDHSDVSGELGRGLRSVGRPDQYGVDFGDAPVVRPRHPDGDPDVHDAPPMSDHYQRTDWSIEDPWEGSAGA